MVRGVDSDLLKNVKAQGLLGSEGLKSISEKLSSLQKKALLVGVRIRYIHYVKYNKIKHGKGGAGKLDSTPHSHSQMRADVNASHLVKEVPDALIASLPFSILDRANINSLDQLEGRSWSSTQVNKNGGPSIYRYYSCGYIWYTLYLTLF